MTELLIFNFLAGAVMGQRFRVVVLAPLSLAIVLAAIPVGLVADVAFLHGLKNAVLAVFILHAGYFLGSLVRSSTAPTARVLSTRSEQPDQSPGARELPVEISLTCRQMRSLNRFQPGL